MMIDLALSVMEDEQIAEIVNLPFMDPPHQERFAEAVAALRADDIRMVRVDIDTDSMSFLDDQLRAVKINNGVATLSRGLEQIAQMVQTSPDYAGVALQALLLSLEAMGLGKEFEDMVRKSVQGLIEKAENPPEPPPPPPDYEMLKIQVAQAKVDSTMAVKQRELDLQSQEIMMSQMKDQAKAQNDAGKLQIESYKAELDETVQSFMMQIEGHRVGLEEARVMIEQQGAVLDSQRLQLEQAALQIEQFKAQVQASESMLEEIRLAKETDLATYEQAVGTAEKSSPEAPAAPNINIINVPAKSEAPKIVPIIPGVNI
jgi:hypothetical protein